MKYSTLNYIMSYDYTNDSLYKNIILEADEVIYGQNNYLENTVESANENNDINYVDGNDINSNPYARFTMDDYKDLLAFAGEANNYDMEDVSEGAKRAAADVLMGVAENQIGDAYYFLAE